MLAGNLGSLLYGDVSVIVTQQVTQQVVSVEFSFGFFIVLNSELFVNRDDSLTSLMVIMRTKQPTKCFVPLQKLRVRMSP